MPFHESRCHFNLGKCLNVNEPCITSAGVTLKHVCNYRLHNGVRNLLNLAGGRGFSEKAPASSLHLKYAELAYTQCESIGVSIAAWVKACIDVTPPPATLDCKKIHCKTCSGKGGSQTTYSFFFKEDFLVSLCTVFKNFICHPSEFTVSDPLTTRLNLIHNIFKPHGEDKYGHISCGLWVTHTWWISRWFHLLGTQEGRILSCRT